MTVNELIEELRKYPPDMVVLKLFPTIRGHNVLYPDPHIEKVDSINTGTDYHIPSDDDYYPDAITVEVLCI
jgi:hypothetical protein